jgi:thiol-disulfide isomerase/thioredoxin
MKRLHLIALALLAGCGPGGGSPADMAKSCGAGAYPPGPYGATQGSILDNLTLSGRRDENMSGSPTDDPQKDIHFADYYKDPSVKALVILTAAEWCQPCKAEQPGLVTMYKDYKTKGAKVAFIEAIIEDNAGMVAAIANVDAWATTYKIPFDMAADPTRALGPYYNKSTFPMQMVVSTCDMSITYMNNGVSSDLQANIDLVLAQ